MNTAFILQLILLLSGCQSSRKASILILSLRGDIYWADLNPTIGHEQSGLRPVLILSNNIFNERSGTVIALALTSQKQKAGFPLTYELFDTELPKRSWVKISQIRTISILRIKNKLGNVSPEELDQIIEELNEIISS